MGETLISLSLIRHRLQQVSLENFTILAMADVELIQKTISLQLFINSLIREKID